MALEDILLKIGHLSEISKGVDKVEDPSRRGNLYLTAAQIISHNLNPDNIDITEYLEKDRIEELQKGKELTNEERITIYKQAKEDMFKETLNNLRISPEYAQIEILGSIDRDTVRIKNEYLTKKEGLTNYIAEHINKKLKEAETEEKASNTLIPYLIDILGDAPELDQAGADEYAQEELIASTGLPFAFETRGSISHYKERHSALHYRLRAKEYLKKNEEDGRVTYGINSEKLGKIMDDIKKGASLYTKVKTVETMDRLKAEKSEQ